MLAQSAQLNLTLAVIVHLIKTGHIIQAPTSQHDCAIVVKARLGEIGLRA
jgi:hypothetical protein